LTFRRYFGQTVNINSYFDEKVLCQSTALFTDESTTWKVLLGVLKDVLTCQDTVPTVKNTGNNLSKDMGKINSKNNGKIIY
jgi:hypothetical protein